VYREPSAGGMDSNGIISEHVRKAQ